MNRLSKQAGTCFSLVAAMILCAFLTGARANDGLGPGAMALDFTLADLSGKQVTLSGYRGKVVLLNFWAMWCRPCRAEMPSMEKLHQEYRDKGLVMLAVNLDRKTKDKVDEFLVKGGYTFPVLLDPESEVSGRYNVPFIPATFLIDRDGRIVAREFGARNWSTQAVKNKIEELLPKN